MSTFLLPNELTLQAIVTCAVIGYNAPSVLVHVHCCAQASGTGLYFCIFRVASSQLQKIP